MTSGRLKEPEAMRPGGTPSRHVRPELVHILHEVRKLGEMVAEKIRRDEFDEETVNDWKFAAMVVDRLCLIAFTSFLIISTFAILFAAPHLIA